MEEEKEEKEEKEVLLVQPTPEILFPSLEPHGLKPKTGNYSHMTSRHLELRYRVRGERSEVRGQGQLDVGYRNSTCDNFPFASFFETKRKQSKERGLTGRSSFSLFFVSSSLPSFA